MKRLFIYFLFAILLVNCSREYKIGKISVVDEARLSNIDIAQIAEELIKGMKNIGISNPSNSNATLKITLVQTNSLKEKGKGKNRYSISASMTATLKDGKIEIFQSESTSYSEADIKNAEVQIKSLLYDALLKLDYQCSIRKLEEAYLLQRFNEKKTPPWQREAIIDEIGNRINSNRITDRDSIFQFLINNFSPKKRDIGDKILGILSSMDIGRFKLSDDQKERLVNEVVRYSIGRENHILIHAINILGKIDNLSARSFIFALSTGSNNNEIRNYAREVYNELNKRDPVNIAPITSK